MPKPTENFYGADQMQEKNSDPLFDLFKEKLELVYGANYFVPTRAIVSDWRASCREASMKNIEPVESLNSVESRAVAMPNQIDDLTRIRADLGECTRCKLCDKRTKIVFGEGNPQADLMFIGEGPGEQEDLQGRPFVGKAGQLLDKIIEAMGLKRDQVYIANVVKCRPPGNRAPEIDETGSCEPFLFRQIDVVKPKVIVALGGTALKCLIKNEAKITQMRGKFLEYRGVKMMPTYHPAFLLRNPDAKKDVWEDMKKVMVELKFDCQS